MSPVLSRLGQSWKVLSLGNLRLVGRRHLTSARIWDEGIGGSSERSILDHTCDELSQSMWLWAIFFGACRPWHTLRTMNLELKKGCSGGSFVSLIFILDFHDPKYHRWASHALLIRRCLIYVAVYNSSTDTIFLHIWSLAPTVKANKVWNSTNDFFM